jgi:hypothetical protein
VLASSTHGTPVRVNLEQSSDHLEKSINPLEIPTFETVFFLWDENEKKCAFDKKSNA